MIKPQVFNSAGLRVPLGELVGQGGEGAVYALESEPGTVAKIYIKPPTTQRLAKINALVAMRARDLERLTAWPHYALYNAQGVIAGFVMSRVPQGFKDLHLVCDPKDRKKYFPRADWRFLARVAQNTAILFTTLHKHGLVIGDVNDGAIQVGQDAMVRAIDCDSFQFSHNGTLFRCEVGVDLFTPPELQGKNFADVERTINHDNFGLAVIIFKLLFLGKRPYMGRYLGPGDMMEVQAISEGRFAYGKNRQRLMMDLPRAAPGLQISGPLEPLFEQAFGSIDQKTLRPVALEWVTELGKLQEQIVSCSVNPMHYHLDKLQACPWCEMEALIPALMLFVRPVLSALASGRGLAALLAELKAIKHPGPAPILRSPPPPTAAPAILSAVAASKLRKNTAVAVAAAGLSIVGIAAALWHLSILWMMAVALITYVVRNTGYEMPAVEVDSSAADEAIVKWRQRWQDAEPALFDRQLRVVEELQRSFGAEDSVRAVCRARVQATLPERRKQDFLAAHMLADAEIPGIGAKRKFQLEGYGIETAADVEPDSLVGLPGFGKSLVSSLLTWRAEIDRQFVPNFNEPLSNADQADVEREVQQIQAGYETALRREIDVLRDIRMRIEQTRLLRPQLEKAWQRKAQLEADAEAAKSVPARPSDLRILAMGCAAAVLLISPVISSNRVEAAPAIDSNLYTNTLPVAKSQPAASWTVINESHGATYVSLPAKGLIDRVTCLEIAQEVCKTPRCSLRFFREPQGLDAGVLRAALIGKYERRPGKEPVLRLSCSLLNTDGCLQKGSSL